MKKEDFNNRLEALKVADAAFAKEIEALMADNVTLRTNVEVATGEAQKAMALHADLEAEIAILKNDSSAAKIVPGSYKSKKGTKYGFKKGNKSFRYKGVDYKSEEVIKDAALMEELIKIGYNGLEVVN